MDFINVIDSCYLIVFLYVHKLFEEGD